MAATASRIGFIMQEWRRTVASDATIQTRYGNLARESDDPIETFFDNTADAAVIASARQALLGAERRRFALTIAGIDDALTIATGNAPVSATYRDTERDIDRTMLVAEVAIDLDRERANLTVWG